MTMYMTIVMKGMWQSDRRR